jgi:ArsR family transcriptional regulator
MDPVLGARERQTGRCCTPFVEPDLSAEEAGRLAPIVKALAHPARMQIVDAVRKAAPDAVCQCELLPLFEMSQPALAKHLRLLVDAGVLGTERRGVWAYYYERPQGLAELRSWLS